MDFTSTRRHFLTNCSLGLGSLWCALQGDASAGESAPIGSRGGRGNVLPHHRARARRVVFLHMAGGPSHLELFDHKPTLAEYDGKECPESFLRGKRFAFIQGVPRLMSSRFPYRQHGECGAWLSDRLPHLAAHVDSMCFLKGMHTDQFNHAPAQLAMHTGFSNLGYPSMGSWVTWGLGSPSEDLPGYLVLLSGGKTPDAGKSAWGAGFLPSVYQGVQCRSQGDPVLYLADPPGISRSLRRRSLDALAALHDHSYRNVGDPETLTRTAQYETAFRMQVRAAEAFDLSREPQAVKERYGVQPGAESFANNCLLARRLLERGVRFVQLFHWGWDSHGAAEAEALTGGFVHQCEQVDRPTAALLHDLEQRGLLEDTLVVWSGEFGRTPMSENRGGRPPLFPGRDHNPGGFTTWMAGGGVRGGTTFGATDELGYDAVEGRTSVHDLQATVLHLLGYDPFRLTYPFQGAEQRLTNLTKPSRVIEEVLA